MSADVVRLGARHGQPLVELLRSSTGHTVSAVMGLYAEEIRLMPLVWALDDPQAVERPWPAVPRLAIIGAPAVGVAAPADPPALARGWADALCLMEFRSRVRGVVEWRGDVDGMAVRVWARTDGRPSITCPTCCRTSWHPEDVRQRYCSACGYHDGSLVKGDQGAGERR